MSVSKRIDLTDIAGVVVLYNPDDQFFENIKTYLHQVDKLYVVDNSDKPLINVSQYIGQISKIHYIKNEGNKGIAYALNVASQAAIVDGYSHLLTMDDDSQAPIDMVEDMISFHNKYPYSNKLGIISVSHSKPFRHGEYKKVLFTMTSGNIVNLHAYQKVGAYNEKLFIDHVDHEFGIRLNLLDYEVIEIAGVKLIHRLGTSKSIYLLGYKYNFVSHSPLRLYYFTRNGFYIINSYVFSAPFFCMKILKLVIIELLKSFLLDDDKKIRFIYLIKAIKDAQSKNLGKINM